MTENPPHFDEEQGPSEERIRRSHEDRSRSRRKLMKHRERLDNTATLSEEERASCVPGRVVQSEGAFWTVRLRDGNEIFAKSYKGTLSPDPRSTLVAVGDNVLLDEVLTETGDGSARIREVLPRSTKLSRKAAGVSLEFEQIIAANVDQLVVVSSVRDPDYTSGIIDRYIVSGLEGGLSIAIVLNKSDLLTDTDRGIFERLAQVYSGIGYPSLLISTETGEGLPTLEHVLEHKTSVFAGHSGVGKSSIFNYLLGREENRIGRLQRKFNKGAHTTSGAILLPLSGLEDTYIVDTPGVREFANYAPDLHNLKFYFEEFALYQLECAMPNCSHSHEPGCAVQSAVENNVINPERYMNYIKLLEEALEHEKKQSKR